jgi:solute carrier family 25 folate transporter 32
LVFFPCYEKLKIYFKAQSGQEKLSSFYILLATFISKTLASTLSYPHEVVRARIQYKVRELNSNKEKENMIRLLRRMIKTEGVLSIYSGFFANLARILPNTAIVFILYEKLSL